MARITIAAIQLQPGDVLEDGQEVILREPGRIAGRVVVRTTGRHAKTLIKPDRLLVVDRPERQQS